MKEEVNFNEISKISRPFEKKLKALVKEELGSDPTNVDIKKAMGVFVVLTFVSSLIDADLKSLGIEVKTDIAIRNLLNRIEGESEWKNKNMN